ncbi:hypothetical protein [Mesorhizobium humile]|uniref:Lipocalin-like domain-containing protein n=1 Tax=Mesorhizobium humile TaxID=3072313 RepID=A0ABU4YQ63_9HYPH|nr:MULTISPECIES: hypothetical protein [unclassified Mesorhizobium]MDX8457704.1 hypothetical protein [Mesorhizobium sp. VK2D]MDX8489064.1 hypothetical protein [Mesorhizobium sp. VK2B]
MLNRIKMAGVAATLLTIGVVGTAYAPTIASISTARAQTQYLPTEKDFIGKWTITGSAIRPPRDLKEPASPDMEAAATEFQQTVTAFYGAFDYLEITADGRYNFHQPGDPASGSCVWCGTWSFKNDSLWLALDTAPRLDIYAKGGDLQMTYTAEPEKTSRYKWLVFGWTRAD